MQVDAVRRISIEATQKGVAESTAILKQLAAAQDGVTVASDRTEKATLSVERALEKQQLSLDVAYRSSIQFEKAQRTLDQAQQQGLVTSTRHAELSALNAQRYGQVTGAQKAMTLTTQTLNLQVAALASGLGITGQVLAAFGPWGFAAAVGLGAVQAALSLASDMSHKLAEKAKEIHEFSEATGLTTTQFQALRSEAGKFGVDAETLAGGLSKFTVGFQELRLGSGSLLTDINRINPALAEQMQQTTHTATAFTLYGQAVAQTSNIFERNALLKAGLGKGAATYGAFIASAPDVAGLAASFLAAGKGIDEALIPKLKQLQIDISKTQSAANNVFASMFGSSTLESELQFQKGLLAIATTIKGFEISADLRKFIDFITNPATLTVLAALAAAGAIAVAPASLVAAGALGVAGAGLGAGAVIGGIRGQGGTAPDADRPRVTITQPSAANDNGAGAAEAAARTMQATAASAKALADVLGSAASPAEKLNAALLGLKVKAAEAGVSTDILDRGLAALNLDDVIARQNAHNQALGASASVTDVVAAKTLELVRAQQQGAGLTPKQIADQISLAREQALGTAQIKGQIDATNVQAATIGMSAGAATAYAAKQNLLNEAIRSHKTLTDADRASIDEQAKALGAATTAAEKARINGQNAFDGKTAFLSPQDLQIATQLRGLYGDDVPAALASSEAVAMRLNASFKNVNDTIRDAAQSLTKDFVSGLVAGKSVMASLGQAATNLSAKLTDKAIESLFSGDLLSAGIQGIGALVSGLFGASQKKRDEEEKAQKAAVDRMVQYTQRASNAGLDTSTRAGSLAGQENQFQAERMTEAQNGNRALEGLLVAQNAERVALQKDWDDKEIAAAKAKQDAVDQRTMSAQDRLFAALNDNTTLEGQLAAADREFAAQRLDEMKQGGEALNDLVASQEAERINIIKKYNTDLLNFVQNVAKTIRDYLQNLKTGSSSTLSPQQQLAAAQANYDSTLAKAKGGDRDALSSITQVAQTLLDQARSFYASSAGYTDIYNKVVSSLTGVADISTSTVSDADKIVAAVTAGKIATTATIETTSLQEQSLLGAMNLVLQAINTFADRFTQAIDGLGAITANIGNSEIALLGVVAKQTVPEHHWYDFAKGGTVGNYATGGMVGNGLYGVDSVLARYASGGTIGLAGGEYVMPADTTRLWKPQLDAMRTGMMPRQDNRRPATNDNGQDMRELGRLIATGNAAIVNRLERVEAAFGAGTAAIATGARRVAEKKKMPGS